MTEITEISPSNIENRLNMDEEASVNDCNKKYNCGVYYPGFENDEQIENDTFFWNKYFDVTDFLNGNGIKEYK